MWVVDLDDYRTWLLTSLSFFSSVLCAAADEKKKQFWKYYVCVIIMILETSIVSSRSKMGKRAWWRRWWWLAAHWALHVTCLSSYILLFLLLRSIVVVMNKIQSFLDYPCSSLSLLTHTRFWYIFRPESYQHHHHHHDFVSVLRCPNSSVQIKTVIRKEWAWKTFNEESYSTLHNACTKNYAMHVWWCVYLPTSIHFFLSPSPLHFC